MLETNEFITHAFGGLEVTLAIVVVAIIATERVVFSNAVIPWTSANKYHSSIFMTTPIPTVLSVGAPHTLALSCNGRTNEATHSDRSQECMIFRCLNHALLIQMKMLFGQIVDHILERGVIHQVSSKPPDSL